MLRKLGLPLVMPHNMDATAMSRCGVTPFQREVARRSAAALGDRSDSLRYDAVQYRGLAVTNGWLSQERDVNAKMLSSLIVRLAGRRLLDKSGIFPASASQWPPLMLRPGVNVPFVPLKHIIVTTVLSTQTSGEDKILDYRSTGPSASCHPQLDSFYAAAARSALSGLLRQGETGVPTERFLRSVGGWGAYKHRKASLPMLRSVVLKFRGSSASVKRLAQGRSLFRNHTTERVS
jgi:hypothetical protein